MIYKINKSEKDSFKKACATYGAEIRFYTIENNDSVLQAELLEDGKEIKPYTAFFIGRETGMERMQKEAIRIFK